MGEYLDGVALKVCRAHLHLCELDAEIRGWFNSDAYAVPVELDDDGWSVFRLQIKSGLPSMLGVLVGDLAHNLRSALDQMIWESCRLNNKPPGGHLKFPICLTEGIWLKDVEERDVAERGKGPLDGLGDDAIRLVKLAQPYHGVTEQEARTAALSWLNWLSNTDKHKHLHASTTVLGSEPFRVSFQPPEVVTASEVEVLVDPGTPLDGEIKIARGRASFPETGPEPKAQLQMSIGVVFGDRYLDFSGLERIEWGVNQVVRHFATDIFFESPTLPDLVDPHAV